jgi:hypothetical protein
MGTLSAIGIIFLGGRGTQSAQSAWGCVLDLADPLAVSGESFKPFSGTLQKLLLK